MKKLWFKFLYLVTPLNTKLNDYAYNSLYTIWVEKVEGKQNTVCSICGRWDCINDECKDMAAMWNCPTIDKGNNS